ncbi:DoxX family protein [Chryseobacterium profundimaris]|uniref:Uncharacterized membrane protein n=1 Tax=Chryseobacterium profundimaris TaxID=1387275 RepID=A0ABY1P0B3_9FLAO|nr:hypothetical protein [Chryseobacterium profundimaris]SMP23273.1 Uncharacterized membrane protein [Chryseobacterium profundimaris]
MKPLFILLSVFCASLLTIKIFRGNFNFYLSMRIAMSAMLIFTATGHFMFFKGMSMMLPEFIPFKTEIVYLTGILEILAAVGIFVPEIRITTAWLLIIFFILILPSNIFSAINHIDYQKATFNGDGISYLWFRIPLQIFFMIWVYLSAIKF